MFNIKNIQFRYNYDLLVKTLCTSYIIMNLFDATITINVIQSGMGYEGNVIISKIIDKLSLYPAMVVKIAVIMVMIYFAYRESMHPTLKPFLGVVSSRFAILIGLIIINIMYVFIVVNNMFVLIQ